MDKIKVEGIKLYGYHGCLAEEAKIGAEYLVNVCVWTDLDKASQSDKLGDTVDYVLINQIVAEEMAIRAELIENVTERILNRLMNEQAAIKKAEVELSKTIPPINGNVEKVTIVMKRKR
tara:strand:+ start:441 stop:797 length:357 start_codon:yes stop_codon:yes gene_type:complete